MYKSTYRQNIENEYNNNYTYVNEEEEGGGAPSAGKMALAGAGIAGAAYGAHKLYNTFKGKPIPDKDLPKGSLKMRAAKGVFKVGVPVTGAYIADKVFNDSKGLYAAKGAWEGIKSGFGTLVDMGKNAL